ncbi:MAG TPA: TolC family protein [Sedimentisphaerales bacterium]|nr:TolC family protein [Sedimentisphaerales bacterium]
MQIEQRNMAVRRNGRLFMCSVGSRSAVSAALVLVCIVLLGQAGCKSPAEYRQEADNKAYHIIEQKQREAIGNVEEFTIERPSDILRRRLLTEQQLLYSGKVSLGTDKLDPIEHWPEDEYPQTRSSPDANIPIDSNTPLKISLVEALQIGARNSPEYQSSKEDVFRAALDLDLERHAFRNTFVGQVESLLNTDSTGNSTVSGTENSATVGVSRALKSGVDLSTTLAIDLANLLTQGGASSLGLRGDATVSIPLLRGSGRHIITEPLTQAERNVVYAIYNFERFKRTFAVNVAREYLVVLRQTDQVENAERSYRSRIESARWIRRLADAGRRSEIEVDQAVQSELGARNGWISAQEQYRNRLDAFKTSLGLPPDAQIELDRSDLELLRRPAEELVKKILQEEDTGVVRETPPADAPVELVPPSDEDAGPLEIDESLAIQLALENRLDLRVAIGEVYDAQRQVVVWADALGAGLTLLGSANLGEGRSIVSATADDAQLSFDKARYSTLLTLDLPLERTAERNAYRKSFIDLERATRNVQTLEDQVKLFIRSELRSLIESRESLKIQARSVFVAQKQVKSSTMFLEAGMANMRDLREAQDALLVAQNSLTQAVITYRTTELELQQDMGLLQVDENGMWREFSPEVTDNVKK